MATVRRGLVAGYWILFLGLVLAYAVTASIPGVPQPPACSTANCNAADYASLFGLLFVVVGMVSLGLAIYRTEPPPDTPTRAGLVSPPYSFSGTVPPAPPTAPGAPAPLATPGPAVRTCPGCGAAVTAQYGFCPRCGRTLSP